MASLYGMCEIMTIIVCGNNVVANDNNEEEAKKAWKVIQYYG